MTNRKEAAPETGRLCRSCRRFDALSGISTCAGCKARRDGAQAGRTALNGVRARAINQARACAICGVQVGPRNKYCTAHIPTISKEQRRRLAEGLCRRCAAPSETGQTLCSNCARSNRASSMKAHVRRMERGKSEGCCNKCAESRLPGLTVCRRHYFMDKAAKALGACRHWRLVESAWTAQEGRCAHSGLPLTLGKDASVDHIVPVATSPELMCEPSNLVWCHSEINRMKGGMPLADFIALCRAVATH